MKKNPPIHVDFEYGTLKEVVLGIPFNIYPDIRVAHWVSEALGILPEDEAAKIVAGPAGIPMKQENMMQWSRKTGELTPDPRTPWCQDHRPEQLAGEQVIQNFGEEFLRLFTAFRNSIPAIRLSSSETT